MTQYYEGQRLTHLSKMEAFLWTKFLEEHGSEFFNYKYDVHLKKPITLPPDLPPKYAENAIQLTSLRIDATMEDKRNIYIVELRPDAKHSAIGSLIMYRFLYKLQYQPQKIVKMVLITNLYDPAIELTARAIEMPYFVY